MNTLNQKGKCTGFKDCCGKEIHVGDIVVEGCNLFVSTVQWDENKGTYKLKGLGDYYISDAPIEWMIIQPFEKTKEILDIFPYRLSLKEYNILKNKK